MALADSVIGELHLLEQMSSDEHLGSLAEAVLEAVKGHPEAARRVDQVRHYGSVADPGCLSRILIFIHPGSRIHQQHQKRGEKIFGPVIFCSYKYYNIVRNFVFEQVKKIYLAKILRIIILFSVANSQ
jgi:hypothetical protein